MTTLRRICVLLVLAPLQGVAQTVSIPDQPQCDLCELTLSPVLTLGNANSDIPYDVPVAASVTNNRLFLTMRADPAQVFVFDLEGNYIAKFGRNGAGPGEYRIIEHIISDNNLLYILDRPLQRATVLDANFEVRQVFRLPVRPLRALLFSSDQLILNAIVPTADLVGMPLHTVDTTGAIAASFGETETPFSLRSPLSAVRNLAKLPSDSVFWSAHRDRFQIDAFTASGKLVRSVVRVAPWLPIYEAAAEPPIASVADITFDEAGLLWVLITARQENWRSALDAAQANRDPAGVNSKVWDSIIEVIDLNSGAVLARKRYDEHLIRFAGPRFLTSYKQHEDGTPQITVWRVTLSRP